MRSKQAGSLTSTLSSTRYPASRCRAADIQVAAAAARPLRPGFGACASLEESGSAPSTFCILKAMVVGGKGPTSASTAPARQPNRLHSLTRRSMSFRDELGPCLDFMNRILRRPIGRSSKFKLLGALHSCTAALAASDEHQVQAVQNAYQQMLLGWCPAALRPPKPASRQPARHLACKIPGRRAALLFESAEPAQHASFRGLGPDVIIIKAHSQTPHPKAAHSLACISAKCLFMRS